MKYLFSLLLLASTSAFASTVYGPYDYPNGCRIYIELANDGTLLSYTATAGCYSASAKLPKVAANLLPEGINGNAVEQSKKSALLAYKRDNVSKSTVTIGLRQTYKANTGTANPVIGTTPLVAGTATASGTVLSGANNNPPNSTNYIYPAENSDKAKATCNGRSGCGYSCNTPTTNQCKCTCQSEQTW